VGGRSQRKERRRERAIAQVTAIGQTLLEPPPPGITPPLILQYNTPMCRWS
jgi:hypothetical protein